MLSAVVVSLVTLLPLVLEVERYVIYFVATVTVLAQLGIDTVAALHDAPVLRLGARRVGADRTARDLRRLGAAIRRVVGRDVVQDRTVARADRDGFQPCVLLERIVDPHVLVFDRARGGHVERRKRDDDIGLAEVLGPFRRLAGLFLQQLGALVLQRVDQPETFGRLADLAHAHGVLDRARKDPKRIVFPEGEHDKALRAAKILVDEGIAHPILLARPAVIAARLRDLELPVDKLTLLDVDAADQRELYARRLHEMRRRDGVTLGDARKLVRDRNYFGTLMLQAGDADGLIAGLTQHYPETIRPALQVIGTRPGVRRVSGAYILLVGGRLLFLADTTVNIDPTPEELAEIALLTVDLARRFGVVPRVAMLSFSNFGSNTHPAARKVRRATEIVHAQEPALEIDGEMQADTAVFEGILNESYPWSRLKEPANVLIFPELQSANIAYKLIWRLANAEAVGPILLGMGQPVHVLQSGLEVSDIVNMAALCVVDAQELARRRRMAPAEAEEPAGVVVE